MKVFIIFLLAFGNANSLSFEFSATAWPSKTYGKLFNFFTKFKKV